MKTIQSSFTKKKFEFTLIKREENVVLFKKTQGEFIGYEVMLVNTAKRDVTMGGVVTMHAGDEFLPSDSQWGRLGWSYHNLVDAEARFNKCLGIVPEEIEPEVEVDEVEE